MEDQERETPEPQSESPEPTPEPTPEPPAETPTMEVPCGNCHSMFQFPEADDNGKRIDAFKFQCNNCGAQNQWSRT